MTKEGRVYICHHVDTEGPLWEEIKELFDRLRIIFNIIDIDPTFENLKKLQKGELLLKNVNMEQLHLSIDPHTIGFKKNWQEIEEMLLRIMSPEFRNKLKDSDGNGWIYNWHIMDHVGFIENPRHRDMGYLNIFNFYDYIIKFTKSKKDAIHWHFHPIPFYKQANIPATSYDNSMYEIHQIISRRLIEKNWFPVVNRAGFHTERIDSNFFLEQWIPFDPSNQAISEDKQPIGQLDLIAGRFGDWRGAPADWSIYHPCIYDWRKKGNCNRVIARVLNMKSRHRNISYQEVENAFLQAVNGVNVYLGITNHDWREMSVEIDEFRDILKNVSEKYKNIKFNFMESIDAFRRVLSYNDSEIVEEAIDFDVQINNNILTLTVTNGELFGPQPYLALKTTMGDYFHDNFDFHEFKKSFSYTFDDYTIPLNKISKIGIASNDKYGNMCIINIEIKNNNANLKKIKK
ncbi:MAG: hypothetical protein RBR70_01580 [Arcobacter sp.]|jgi:hypothetical protein|uniref:hypothetical protein n=1 Tax=Arcobacter sp. TaxID=1872629 RepID=UPI002A7622C4|nr:hypothetical protein [Arcobacter sp.]MDY3203746.1 hypothetical protein [Arcobacter sp.]